MRSYKKLIVLVLASISLINCQGGSGDSNVESAEHDISALCNSPEIELPKMVQSRVAELTPGEYKLAQHNFILSSTEEVSAVVADFDDNDFMNTKLSKPCMNLLENGIFSDNSDFEYTNSMPYQTTVDENGGMQIPQTQYIRLSVDRAKNFYMVKRVDFNFILTEFDDNLFSPFSNYVTGDRSEENIEIIPVVDGFIVYKKLENAVVPVTIKEYSYYKKTSDLDIQSRETLACDECDKDSHNPTTPAHPSFNSNNTKIYEQVVY